MEPSQPDNNRLVRVIEQFRSFLNRAWPTVSAVLREHDWDNDAYFLEDWLDQNWSLLVGRQIVGKGGDFQPLCIGTNEVGKHHHRFSLRSVKPIVADFVALGASSDGFAIEAPFDTVKLMEADGTITLHPFNLVTLELRDWSISPTSDSPPSTPRG